MIPSVINSPKVEIILIVWPVIYITPKVAAKLTGIPTATQNAVRRLRNTARKTMTISKPRTPLSNSNLSRALMMSARTAYVSTLTLADTRSFRPCSHAVSIVRLRRKGIWNSVPPTVITPVSGFGSPVTPRTYPWTISFMRMALSPSPRLTTNSMPGLKLRRTSRPLSGKISFTDATSSSTMLVPSLRVNTGSWRIS